MSKQHIGIGLIACAGAITWSVLKKIAPKFVTKATSLFAFDIGNEKADKKADKKTDDKS